MTSWVYLTNVRPRRKKKSGEEGNIEYQEEFTNSYNNFFEFCTNGADAQEIKRNIDESDNKTYKFEIDTEGDKDQVNPNSDYCVKFTKSRFLSNQKFKRSLIEYFNPKGLYVKGPYEIKKKVGENHRSVWIIEFSFKNGTY